MYILWHGFKIIAVQGIASEILVNIDTCNGLLPNGTKP